ncbi:MAG: methyltransferase [Saprospiraceae bacterium]|jgi:tRNA1Val (adenine37-N6)-methyltransferase|nr:methyltransferase [Saprospiraceae bacterium]MBK8296295.1 methyltransferase [Saprospiraceae bacterium]
MALDFTKEAFRFKQFAVFVSPGVFPVTTDAVLLGSWIQLDQAAKILDIGTGSGILSLMAAQKAAAHAHIIALDSDKNSIQCAMYNFEQSPWHSKLDAICLNAEELIDSKSNQQLEDRFDQIICNPPFFVDSLLSPNVDKNRARHQLTLSFPLLVKIAKARLNPNGKISLVLPAVGSDMIVNQMQNVDLYLSRVLKVRNKQSSKTNRVLLEFTNAKTVYTEFELFLYDENGMRSKEYSVLTREYYL